LPVSVKAKELGIFHIFIFRLFKKIKGLKKVVIGSNVVAGLRAIKPEADRVDPVMHFGVQVFINVSHRLMICVLLNENHAILLPKC
jgi:hypothetical protein